MARKDKKVTGSCSEPLQLEIDCKQAKEKVTLTDADLWPARPSPTKKRAR